MDELIPIEITKPFKKFTVSGVGLTQSEKDIVKKTVDAMFDWMLTQGNLYFRRLPEEAVEHDIERDAEHWKLNFIAAFSDQVGQGQTTLFNTGSELRIIKL